MYERGARTACENARGSRNVLKRWSEGRVCERNVRRNTYSDGRTEAVELPRVWRVFSQDRTEFRSEIFEERYTIRKKLSHNDGPTASSDSHFCAVSASFGRSW